MQEVINGQAILHGIQNDGSALTISGYATFILDKISGSHEFEKYVVRDAIGFTASKVAYDESIKITIDFTPSGATRAAAAAIPTVPIPLAAVTLAHNKVQTTFGSSSGKLFDGTYHYDGGAKIEFSNSQPVKMSGIELVKFADATQNSSMTTTVSG